MKEHSDSKSKYSEDDIIKMLEFLVDNIFVVFARKVFQQTVGIPMGTNCAPLLADIFLYSYEADFIQSLLSTGKKHLASRFNLTYRYIDDVLSINNPEFENYLGQMYPAELEIKDTTESTTSASYLDLLLSIGRDSQLHTSIYDKRDDFNFHITNFPFLSSNIPSSPAYGVFISQLIRYARACSSYECFILRARRLSSKLLKQGYLVERLKSSFRKFYGRYGDLVEQYGVTLSRMLNDILTFDQQWPPYQSDFPPISWPLYRAWPSPNYEWFSMEHLQRVWLASRERLPLRTPGSAPFRGLANALIVETSFSRLYTELMTVPNLTFTELREVSMEHLRRVWLASRERLPFRTPGSVPHFGTCQCSNCWDQIPRTCHVFTRLFTSNTPWYFLDFTLKNCWQVDARYWLSFGRWSPYCQLIIQTLVFVILLTMPVSTLFMKLNHSLLLFHDSFHRTGEQRLSAFWVGFLIEPFVWRFEIKVCFSPKKLQFKILNIL